MRIRPGSIVVGALGALTLGLVTWSNAGLAAAEGGVFFGGLFVLVAGTVLAVAVMARALVGGFLTGGATGPADRLSDG